MTYSPLRYPGGKNKLAPFIAKICADNSINGHYIEPYSGGAAVSLFLLFEGFVKNIIINDNDRSIYAFWHSVLNNSDKLCDKISSTPVTIEEWKRQREVQKNKENCDLLELGFSTFFLNRTNRSGIIKGGVIGGINQCGDYKLDCRFNKDDLIKRIKSIAQQRDNISLYNEDALNLLDMDCVCNSNPNNMLIYFDPPYYVKGQSLYTNYYKKNHHKLLCDRIKNLRNINWLVSYDDADEIKLLYSDYPKIEYCINHTASSSKKGKELIFLSPTIIVDQDKNPPQYKFKNKILYVETDTKKT